MPDFEKSLRDFEIYHAPSEQAKREIHARHLGLDRARKEIAWLFLVVAAVGCTLYYFTL